MSLPNSSSNGKGNGRLDNNPESLQQPENGDGHGDAWEGPDTLPAAPYGYRDGTPFYQLLPSTSRTSAIPA